jgi:hypothetical protein
MKKEFAPYELALELKQLGFDEPCLAFYERSKELIIQECEVTDFHTSSLQCLAPLYQQAFKWFREKHNIDAWVQPFVYEKENGKPFLPDESYAYYIFEDGVYVADGINFLDSEEAEMACLKKLIDHCKNGI